MSHKVEIGPLIQIYCENANKIVRTGK